MSKEGPWGQNNEAIDKLRETEASGEHQFENDFVKQCYTGCISELNRIKSESKASVFELLKSRPGVISIGYKDSEDSDTLADIQNITRGINDLLLESGHETICRVDNTKPNIIEIKFE